jgi:hypothetical protein
MATGRELNYNTGASAFDMAQEIFGSGTIVVDARYSGWSQSSAIYSAGDSRAPGATPSDRGVILSTGRANNYTQSNGDPNRSASTSTGTSGPNIDSMLNAATGTNTYDAAILEVDFIPTGNVMTLQFQFASEEYPEFTGSECNDIFAIWMNGNLVVSPVFQVTQINAASNPNLFQNNMGDDFNTEMDGLTVTLSVTMPVDVGVENTLRIGIADVADSSYDSTILIAANSAQTTLVAQDDAIAHFEGNTVTLDVLANDGTGGMMQVTHINGTAVLPNGSVTLNCGHAVTLLASGDLQIQPPTSQSGLTGPEVMNFSNYDAGRVGRHRHRVRRRHRGALFRPRHVDTNTGWRASGRNAVGRRLHRDSRSRAATASLARVEVGRCDGPVRPRRDRGGHVRLSPPARRVAAAPHPSDPLDGRADVRRGKGACGRQGSRQRLLGP